MSLVAPDGTGIDLPTVVPSSDPALPPVRWGHRHLLDLDVVSWPEIELVMRTTEAMREILAMSGSVASCCTDRVRPSTRFRVRSIDRSEEVGK